METIDSIIIILHFSQSHYNYLLVIIFITFLDPYDDIYHNLFSFSKGFITVICDIHRPTQFSIQNKKVQ